jgi:hypothetical protein
MRTMEIKSLAETKPTLSAYPKRREFKIFVNKLVIDRQRLKVYPD